MDKLGIVAILNLIVFSAMFCFSVYDLIKYDRTRAWWKTGDVYLSFMYALVAILFIQLYARMLAGMETSRAEVRVYLMCAGFTMMISAISAAIRHGIIDGAISRLFTTADRFVDRIISALRSIVKR